jgi:hypothetical protein
MKKKPIKYIPVLDLFRQAKENRSIFLEPYKIKYLDAKKRLDEIRFFKYQGVLTAKQAEDQERGINKVEYEILKIMSDLIKLEASHLAESWILKQVVDWMREYKYRDSLEEIFIKQTNRDRPTPDEEFSQFKYFAVYNRIEALRNEAKRRGGKKISIMNACRLLAFMQGEKPNKLYPQWDNDNEEQELWRSIRKNYYLHKATLKNRKLPFPYSDGMGGFF